MSYLKTFPDMKVIADQAMITPEYMRPNTTPVAVIAESFLLPEQCDVITEKLMSLPPYKSEHCGAMTRECGHIPELDPLLEFATTMNNIFWTYELDPIPMSWLQTYYSGGDYRMHMDYTPGGTRKLTAVLMLSEPNRYDGGDLQLYFEPLKITVPRARGTIAVFQPWLLHKVTRVPRGIRQTINMGFWGPPFR